MSTDLLFDEETSRLPRTLSQYLFLAVKPDAEALEAGLSSPAHE